MNDILKNNGDNLGGIFAIKVIPVNDVLSLAQPINSRVLEPLVKNTLGRWYDIYATMQTIKYDEQQQNSEHSNYYRAKLIGLIPKDRADIIDTLNEMKSKNFIIDYTDNNGVRKIIGTKTEPLLFSSSFDTGSLASNKNGYSFEFTGDLLNKAPVYLV